MITVLILVAMFSAQRYGTDFVGAAFAPILVIWLLAIAGTLPFFFSTKSKECLEKLAFGPIAVGLVMASQ